MIGSCRVEAGFKHFAQLWPCAVDYRSAGILLVGRCKMYAQSSGALCSESFEMLGPFNQRHAKTLAFINDART
jgi:hypothetical protein